jgi:hypothetical protein
LIGISYKNFDEMLDDARKVALRGEAVTKVAGMPDNKATNNADGIANYV